MSFKIVLLVSIAISCTYAQTTRALDSQLRAELLRRAAALDVVVKAGIQKLHNEKRDHLALLLQEEEKRLETLVHNLTAAKETDSGSLAFLEDQLIQQEFRIKNELNNLEREAATQELLIINAKVLKQKISDELKFLETIQDERKSQAQEAIQAFKKDETRVEQIVQELINAKDQRVIERLEVELRAIETRIYIVLAVLINLQKPTKAPNHSTTASHVTITPRPTQSTTTHAVTSKPTTHPTIRPTTLSPTQIRDFLIKRATQLKNSVIAEVDKLKKENRTTEAVLLQKLELEITAVATKLSQITNPEILQIIDSELYWLEMRLTIELQALVAQGQRAQRLVAIATALKQRITSVEKVLSQTPVGEALQRESTNLDNLLVALKNTKDDRAIDNLELELALIENRVNIELNAISIATTKKF